MKKSDTASSFIIAYHFCLSNKNILIYLCKMFRAQVDGAVM